MRLVWQNTTKHPLKGYRQIAQQHVDDVADHCRCNHEEVGITIVSTRKIKQLNATYRGLNQATDVLTFQGDDTYLGDILICYDVVIDKARELQQSIVDYMRFCIVHGLLHAVGYDHQTDSDYQTMMDLQERLIQRRTL
jgi:probable rRNA maturation factor